MTNKAKIKGSRVERLCVAAFEALGISARKQPLSGALPDYPHDVSVKINNKHYIIEVKARKGEQKTLERWRGEADILLYKADRLEFMCWMPLSVLGELINGNKE